MVVVVNAAVVATGSNVITSFLEPQAGSILQLTAERCAGRAMTGSTGAEGLGGRRSDERRRGHGSAWGVGGARPSKKAASTGGCLVDFSLTFI